MGEKSAGYCGLPISRIRLVNRLLPDVRLILMVRDPVTRHWSHAKRFFSKKKAQRRGYTSLDSRSQLYKFFRRTRRFSEFSGLIENWMRFYPPERLLVISQEAAFANPTAEFGRVLRYLDISENEAERLMKRVNRRDGNVGPAVPMPNDVRDFLEEMFAQEREKLAGLLETHGQADPRQGA